MNTYQELLKVGENDIERALFCKNAVKSFESTAEYRVAKDAQAYYEKHNLTIENFKKMLYTVTGRMMEDVFSANYKLESLFFRRLVTQQVQYVLGNGVTLTSNNENDDTDYKSMLGSDFDFKLQTAAKIAMVQGKSFGFWNLDHLEVFGYADTPKQAGFCPLYDEDTAKLRAGIRFWYRNVENTKVFRATLYEEDGYTEYAQKNGEAPTVLKAKQYYKYTKTLTEFGGVEDEVGSNYSSLPIIPLYASDTQESELVGIRPSIDCYDFIKSGLANVIDDTSDVFWIIENSGGMDDVDLAKFIQRMKTVKSSMVDSEDGQSATPHTINVPYEARKTMLEILRTDIYEDFQALDVKTLSAAAKTTQEIQAAYQTQDNKCADFEYYVLDFVQQILNLAGINANPSFTWNRVVNMAEQTNMILSCAQYLPEDMVIKLLPFITPEQAEQAIKDFQTKQYDSFNNGDELDESRTESGEMDNKRTDETREEN